MTPGDDFASRIDETANCALRSNRMVNPIAERGSTEFEFATLELPPFLVEVPPGNAVHGRPWRYWVPAVA